MLENLDLEFPVDYLQTIKLSFFPKQIFYLTINHVLLLSTDSISLLKKMYLYYDRSLLSFKTTLNILHVAKIRQEINRKI